MTRTIPFNPPTRRCGGVRPTIVHAEGLSGHRQTRCSLGTSWEEWEAAKRTRSREVAEIAAFPGLDLLRATKSLGMVGQSGTDAGQTPVFAGFFRGADGRRGLKTFGWRFPPIRRFSRGGGRVLTPWKIVFDGLLGDPLEPARAPDERDQKF